MLAISEFTCGVIGEAEPLSLVLPRSEHEKPILIGRQGASRVAVFLEGGEHQFHSFVCDGNSSWAGLIVGGVSIEVDETSVVELSTGRGFLGSLIRKGDSAVIRAVRARDYGRAADVALVEGLPTLSDDQGAAFTRWQIVLGVGNEKRVLKTVKVA